MAMSDLDQTGQQGAPQKTMCLIGPWTHTITNLANKPPSPRFPNPPRSLTTSRKPLRCALKSSMFPQYHSFSIKCITAAIASSVVDPRASRCSLSILMLRHLWFTAVVLSIRLYPSSISLRKQADVYMAV